MRILPTNLVIFLILMISSNSFGSIVADLDSDYQNDQTGWSYLWNPTGVQIGSSANYAALTNTSDDFRANAVNPSNDFDNSHNNTNVADTELGVFDNTFSNPAVFDGVTAIQGGRNAANSTDSFNHYVILGYTLQAGDQTGLASITHDGFVTNAGEVLVYVNDSQLHNDTGSRNGLDFTNQALGLVGTGDTIYFAYRTLDSSAARNPSRLFTQFTIDVSAIPEPSTFAMFGLGIFTIASRRRRNVGRNQIG